MINEIEFKHNRLSKVMASLIPGIKVATKQLKIQSVGKNTQKRKLVISTNMLNLFGFTENSMIEEVVSDSDNASGMTIIKTDKGSKKVYGRNYRNRERETLMDVRHQSKLDKAFSTATHAHITFEHGKLTLKPVFNACSNTISEGLEFNLSPEGGIYHGIVDTLNIIKEKAFEQVTIHAKEDFIGSQEHTLLCLQLRRLGYDLTLLESGSMVGTLTGGSVSKTSVIDISKQADVNQEIEFNQEDPLGTFVACTGGVDIHCLESKGYSVKTALDYVPIESRDLKKKRLNDGTLQVTHNDKTEHCALSAAINAKDLEVLINEDFYTFDYSRVSQHIAKANHLHISLQCSDFCSLKNLADREKAIANLSTTRDMIFPAISLVEHTNTPTVLFENVRNFASSIECHLLEFRLKKIGYTVYKQVMNAKDYNGYTGRARCYLFATKLQSDFAFPTIEKRTVHAWDDIISGNEHELRDVTHTSSVAKGIKGGRLRPFTRLDDTAPVVFRAQSRQCKDALYCKINDRYFMPSINILKKLMGIPSDFNLAPFTGETGVEIIGQSICYTMHGKLVQSIKKHILDYASGITNKVKSIPDSVPFKMPSAQLQLALF